jgi:hypothetical protein
MWGDGVGVNTRNGWVWIDLYVPAPTFDRPLSVAVYAHSHCDSPTDPLWYHRSGSGHWVLNALGCP